MYAIDATALLGKVQTLQSLDGWEVIHKHDVMIAPILDVVPTSELSAAHARIAELEAELDAQNDEFVQRLAEKSAEIDCLQSQYKEAMNLLEFAMEQLELVAR